MQQCFQAVDGIPHIVVDDVYRLLPYVESRHLRLIDVRRHDEFNGEYGHIQGAELVTLGPDLSRFLEDGNRDEEIIFVCCGGARSGQATAESIRYGYKLTANMMGGMILWNDKKFPVVKD